MGLMEIELREWETRTLPVDAALREGFLRDREALSLAHELARSGLLELQESLDVLTISARSHVGRIRLGELILVIQPKLPFSSFMRLLQYAYDLGRIRRLSEMDLLSEARSFQDLLIILLIQEASELLKRGLRRGYLSKSEISASPRGRIDFQSLASGCWEAALPCNYHERSSNCLVNQTLLSGLHLAAGITASSRLRARLHGLAGLMDGVDAIRLHRGVIGRLAREDNRLLAAYRPSIQLIGLLLLENGAAMQGRLNALRIPGFLFDMNRFFQALLGRFLRESLLPWQIVEEYGLKAMMRYHREFNPLGRQAPTPRPDFAVKIGGRVAALLDAKYRDLWRHELPRDMLYQLAMYALGFNLKSSAILYPTLSEEAAEARIVITDPVSGADAAAVSLRPVALPVLEELLTAGRSPEMERQRRRFARELAIR